jgi:hypothetical protein
LYAAIHISPEDRVLIHGDLLAENMVFDLSTRRFIGMFDFAEPKLQIGIWTLSIFTLLEAACQAPDCCIRGRGSGLAGLPAIYHIACAVSHLKTESDQLAPPPQQERLEEWVRLIIDDAF